MRYRDYDLWVESTSKGLVGKADGPTPITTIPYRHSEVYVIGVLRALVDDNYKVAALLEKAKGSHR